MRFAYNPIINNLDLVGITSVQDDPNPTLGGNLNVNGFSIISSNNGDIIIQPNGVGNIILSGEHWPTSDGNAGTFLTTDGMGHLSWATVTGGGFTWTAKTSADNTVTLVNNNGYICNGSSNVIYTLPTSAAVGDTYQITGNTSLFQVIQKAGQQIFFGTQSTTIGVGGSITSLQAHDHVEILCLQANTVFKVIDSIGNLTVI